MRNGQPMGALDFPILYEDNHIIVCVKPVGVLSQADGTDAPDVLTLLKAYIKEKYQKPGAVFLGLVHRLDRPTAGVMVFARTSKAAMRLSDSIKKGHFDKTYLCVTSGSVRPLSGKWQDYLKKDEKALKSFAVDKRESGAKIAELTYSVLDEKENMSLVEVKLLTGRHHQIRVQFASRGFALVGDHKYGSARGKSELALFAKSLSFPHPTTKETLVFTAPLPNFYPFNIF